MTSKKPIFVVGCPRSGTTLVQSLLASNGSLYAQPETNVLYCIAKDFNYRCFGRQIGRRNIPQMLLHRGVNKLGFAPWFTWQDNLERLPLPFAREIERRDMAQEHRIESIYRHFGDVMGTLAAGKRWIEKTPQNLFVIEYIEKFFPTAQFVHVVRSPLANIASIIDATQKFEHFRYVFNGPRLLEKTVAYYNRALDITRARRSNPRHLIIRYEHLTDDVSSHLRLMENFLSLDLNSLQPVYDTSRIANENETWKQKSREIKPAKSRADTIFSMEQIDYIRRHANDPDRLL